MKLRPYQEECIQDILNAEKNGITRQLVVMPTGSGKTVVFASLINARPNSFPCLVLAHREELLEQAKAKFLAINPNLKVEIEQGQNTVGDNCDVVIASVPTLGRSNSTRINKFDSDYFRTIVVDEAHHAAATTYGNVLRYFTPALLVGVTATPQRGDNVRLTNVFDEVVFYTSIHDLIQSGYLCPLSGYRVRSDVDLTGITISGGDYAVGELDQAINIEERNDLVVKAHRELAHGKKTIVFCATVAHADALAEAFRRDGLTAESVVGTTEPAKRSDVLEGLSSGRVELVTNVGVLTEGFDEPSVECIVFARPTRSNLLYTQCVGRGTRINKGKETCIVIDIADTTRGKKPIGLPTLLGLPPDFDLGGGDLMEAAEKFQDLEKKSPAAATTVSSLADIELAWEQIDLFAAPKPSQAVIEHSALIWSEISESNYYLNINNEESLHMSGDALGQYHVVLTSPHGERKLGTADSLRTAFARSDEWVKNNRAINMTLLDSNAIWRKDPPTDKQLKWLKKFGVPITTDLTRGEASLILDKYFKENPPKKKPVWLQNKIQTNKSKGF